jgi:hypothetical protein
MPSYYFPEGRTPVRPQYFCPEKSRASRGQNKLLAAVQSGDFALRIKWQRNFRLFGTLTTFLIVSLNVSAQIQQAWVARYNNGITNGTNQAVKMELDSNGNIIITGLSQNTNNQVGYVTIKYAPNGTQLWAARFDSTNYSSATPSSMAIDSSNNVIVTGNALTVKYDANGNQLWTASYNGAAVAIDRNDNLFVTGYGAGFNTTKLSSTGSNIWSESFTSTYGPATSQVLAVDNAGDVYVAGSDNYVCFSEGPPQDCYYAALLIKYDQNGNVVFTNVIQTTSSEYSVQIESIAIDSSSNIDLTMNGYEKPYYTFSYSQSGSQIWAAFNPTTYGGSSVHALAVDTLGHTLVTGQLTILYPSSPLPIGTFAINSEGAYVWSNLYYSTFVAQSVGTAITIDQANSVYVTGYSPGINGTNNIVTIKYSSSGNQLWVQQYNGINAGNDTGNAIAVDKSGNVYVTGYETLPGGGTGIVTIKYSPVSIQRQTNGTVLIETQGSPGESFDIQASSDLLNWLDLGRFLADTNGLMQFDDTNAPNFPARFYYTNPQ